MSKVIPQEKKDSVNVSLIGGMDRLRRRYIDAAEKSGINLRVFSQAEVNLDAKIQNSDAVVIFTNKISHEAKKAALQVAKSRKIPVLMSHSCGVCSLRECIDCLVNKSFSSSGL
jgi:hypothetical protein